MIPNLQDASLPQQARSDSRDFDAIDAGISNYGVSSGGVVSAQITPDGTVSVTALQAVFSPPAAPQINISVPAVSSLGILTGTGGLVADPTNPRVDLVVVDQTGVVSVLHGTPTAVTTTTSPAFPSQAAIGTDANGIINKVILARIDVPAGATTILPGYYVNKRHFPCPPIIPPIAGGAGTPVFPGQFTQALVTAGGIGAAFILKAGVHPNASIVPLANQTFVGEPGAILDGGAQIRRATAFVGATTSTIFSPDANFTAADVGSITTTPTYVSGMSFSSNAAAIITSSADSTHAVVGDTVGGGNRTFSDGVTTAASPTVTSASGAAFSSLDVGASVVSVNGTIPTNSYIGIVNSTTSIGLSSSPTSNVPVNATGSTPGVISITRHQSGFNLNTARSFADGVINNAKTITSAALAQFTNADVGAVVSGTGIPANTWIMSVTPAVAGATASACTLNNPTTGGLQTVTVSLTQGINRVITLTRPPSSGVFAAFQCAAGQVPANVTIKNLIIQNYASVTGRAAIHPWVLDDFTQLGANWIVEDCEIRNNASIGIRTGDHTVIRHCRIHDNGDMGVGGAGANPLVESNEIYNNNSYNIPLGFDSCGLKLATTNGAVIRRNRVYGNLGLGLWTDVDCFGTLFENNTVWNNIGGGISVETCYTTKILRNYLYANGVPNSANSFFDAPNILISSSSNIEVAYNVVGNQQFGQYHGIGVLAQERVKVTSGGARSVGDMVTNGTTTITSATAAFTRADLRAKVSGTNIPNGPPITTIVDVVSPTQATLSVVASGSGSGGTLNIQQQLDQKGAVLGGGGASSGWYQRCYNIDVHDNLVTTTGTAGATLAGMSTDIPGFAAEGLFTNRGIRFYSNTYVYDHGGDFFAWSSGAFNHFAAWQAFGMDQVVTEPANTGYSPANELLPAPADAMGTAWKLDNLASTAVSNISGAVTIDLSLGSHQRLTQTAAVTSYTAINLPPQGPVVLEFIQNATGGFSRLSPNAVFHFQGGSPGTTTTTALKRDIYTFDSDGTVLYELSRSLNV